MVNPRPSGRSSLRVAASGGEASQSLLVTSLTKKRCLVELETSKELEGVAGKGYGAYVYEIGCPT